MHKVSNSSNITFQADGSPYSTQFDDIYFDTESGCLQSEQVFIQGNEISQKLGTAAQKLTIAETGFGTGLNFLLTIKLYAELAVKKPLCDLHFITTEKYPLTKAELAQSLLCLPEYTDYSRLLIERYPEKLEQNTELSFFDGKVTLSILTGDAAESFANLHLNKQEKVNAWYLDGFSPQKNPDMWQAQLFKQMARLSAPQASVATFTVAGIVRRGLTDNGFRVQRQSYGGKKKEILTGKFQQHLNIVNSYQLRPNRNKPQHVTIIGGGIASACAALALVKKDIKVTVLCKDDTIAQGASSNLIGALYPLIHQTQDDISLFYQQALDYARYTYQSVLDAGFQFAHSWCGLLELSFNDKLLKREQGLKEKAIWPSSLITSLTKEEASAIAHIPLEHSGLFIPNAGWIAPQELVLAMMKMAQNTGLLKIKTNVQVQGLSQNDDKKWSLQTNKGQLKASILVLTAGAETKLIAPFDQLPMYPVKGQVSAMQTNTKINALSTVICHKGYLTPAHNDLHCIGATFDKDFTDTNVCEQSDKYNLSMLQESMATGFDWQLSDVKHSKARLRCMTPDHLPVVGPMAKIDEHPNLFPHLAKDKNWRYSIPAPYYENLYTLTGLGARGLCSAPLLAEILAADICGSPYPVDSNMLFNLSTNRFVIRDIIKRKYADVKS